MGRRGAAGHAEVPATAAGLGLRALGA